MNANSASPVVRRDYTEARRRILRFHASVMMEGPTIVAPPEEVASSLFDNRRASTPWAATPWGAPMQALSWAEEDEPLGWAPPGTPSLPPCGTPSAHSDMAPRRRILTEDDSSPPSTPPGSRKDSLDLLVSESEIMASRTFAGHEAWSMRRSQHIS
ncbi:unnamed protein product [Polarella glacialis]|uniref:Uncharacterized protein n=2 Tax=Polarella glacialis TaxID=89957 RepID=A0A813GH01_POLGL|nr:unnamed protein product [Polarella glacialis]